MCEPYRREGIAFCERPAPAESPEVIPGIAILDDAYETVYELMQSAYEADNSGAGIKFLANTNVGELTEHQMPK